MQREPTLRRAARPSMPVRELLKAALKRLEDAR
jgi:hypothetical protein